MRFYRTQHKHYCGIDLHARSLYLCILNMAGEILYHRKVSARPEAFLRAIAPFREDLVVAVECMFAWYWIADLCLNQGITFVLGHAMYMKAIHGGKAKNDKIDSKKIAYLLRGGNIPFAYVYPPEMRATRDLLRRRNFLMRTRAGLLTHIEITNAQYNLPPFGQRLARWPNRQEVAERFTDPSVRTSVQIDLDLIDVYDQRLKQVELELTRTAKVHDPQCYHLLRTIPGVGKILSLILLYEIHDIRRFARVQDFNSYCRLVKCSRESAGKRTGTGGAKIGNPHLKWAFSEMASLFLREVPQAKIFVKRLESKVGKGKALSILAAKLGRTVYFMLRRNEAFHVNQFFSS
jgi:transposase